MAKVTARLTLFHEPREIDEDEIPNLRSQGLLVEVLSNDTKPKPQPTKPAPASKENAS